MNTKRERKRVSTLIERRSVKDRVITSITIKSNDTIDNNIELSVPTNESNDVNVIVDNVAIKISEHVENNDVNNDVTTDATSNESKQDDDSAYIVESKQDDDSDNDSDNTDNKITTTRLLTYLSNEWKDVLNVKEHDFTRIVEKLNVDKFTPPIENIFNALNSCYPDDVRVVIIGQDPYPKKGDAHGYSFSVTPKTPIPKSLITVYKELMNEYGLFDMPKTGCLISWTKERVMLLNTVLTTKIGESNAHKGIGWEEFTSKVIEYVDKNNRCIFMAWGNFAIKLCQNMVKYNQVIESGHPSPLNTGKNPFIGCGCFKKANEELMKMGYLPIRWTNVWKKE